MRLEEKVYSIYRPTGGQSLPNLLSDLFYCQLRSWDLFAENHAALAQVKTRSIDCKSSDQVADLVSVKSPGQCAGQLFPPVARHLSLVTPSEITIQWNPRRLTSTTAKVDQD